MNFIGEFKCRKMRLDPYMHIRINISIHSRRKVAGTSHLKVATPVAFQSCHPRPHS